MQIAQLGVGKFFGDQDIMQDVSKGSDKKASADDKSKNESEGGSMTAALTSEKSTEPYSVVTASSCEIIYLSR